jgi:hypothetical protein
MASQRRNDVQAVISYLSSLWGFASGLSLLFPLSNTLLQAVPSNVFVEVQPKTPLTPALLTAFASILSLFSVLLIVSTRRDIASSRWSYTQGLARLRGLAVGAFCFAVFLLMIYISICAEYRLHYERLATSERNNAEIFAFFGYPLIFASFTTAFTALGLREYLSEQKEAEGR